MAIIRELSVHVRDGVDLTVLENAFKQPIERIFFIKNLKESSIRGGHKNTKLYEGVICIQGSFDVKTIKDSREQNFHLNSSDKCLIVEPNEWIQITNFEKNSIVLAFSDGNYDVNDFEDKP